MGGEVVTLGFEAGQVAGVFSAHDGGDAEEVGARDTGGAALLGQQPVTPPEKHLALDRQRVLVRAELVTTCWRDERRMQAAVPCRVI